MKAEGKDIKGKKGGVAAGDCGWRLRLTREKIEEDVGDPESEED